jgi:hypothetical protein
MTNPADVKLTITFADPDLDAEEKDQEVQKLLSQMKSLDEVEAVDRVVLPNAPEGTKSVTGWVIGQLITFVKPENVQQVWGFLSDRLGNKAIEIEIEVTPESKKYKLKASSRQELEAAAKTIQELVKKE